MSYKLTLNPDCVFRILDSAYITRSEANSSWDEYEKWLSEGNTSLPADLPPVVPVPEPEVEPVSEVTPVPEPEVVPVPEQEAPAP
jgi:hypothetical protein